MGGERGGNGGCKGRGNCNQDNTYKKIHFQYKKKGKGSFPFINGKSHYLAMYFCLLLRQGELSSTLELTRAK